jgi:hypothetical protein
MLRQKYQTLSGDTKSSIRRLTLKATISIQYREKLESEWSYFNFI